MKNRRDNLCVLAGAVLLTMTVAASPARANPSMPSLGGVQTVIRSIQDHIWFQNRELNEVSARRLREQFESS